MIKVIGVAHAVVHIHCIFNPPKYMRHILVPTDFSKAADNALEYARLLATEFNAILTLAYIHPLPQPPLRLGEVSADLYQDGEKAIEARAHSLRTGGLEVRTEVQLGEPAGRLKKLIHDRDIDLIVMGCQGGHYLSEKFLGSSTTELMEQITVPIIAVPNTYTPGFPQHPLWATDSYPPRSVTTLHPLYELADRTAEELCVFHYQLATEASLPKAELRKLLADVPHDYFCQLADGEGTDRAIRDFVDLTGADLLTLIHRQTSWLRRMLLPSNTRRSVWSSAVPVLILQEAQAV